MIDVLFKVSSKFKVKIYIKKREKILIKIPYYMKITFES